MNIPELKNIGWEIDEELLVKYLEEKNENNKDSKYIFNLIKDTDIKSYGKAVLLNALDRQNGSLQGPVVLQLVKFKNVSHTQSYDGYDPKNDFVKMTFTDGFNNVNGINFGLLTKIGSNTPPGTKVLFEEKITFSDGLLLLSDKNIKVIGGSVDKLINRWKMDKLTIRGGGNLQKNDAPKWIPFSRTQNFMNYQKKENCSIKTNKTLNESGSNNIKNNKKIQTTNKKKFNDQKLKNGPLPNNEGPKFKNKNISNNKIESLNDKSLEKKVYPNNSYKKNQNNLSSKKYINNQSDKSKNYGRSNNFYENNSGNIPPNSMRENTNERGNFSNIKKENKNFKGNKSL